MDDPHTVYATPERLDRTMSTIKALGADRVRISVYWRLIAPSPDQKAKPSFGAAGAASPAGYPKENWARYDRIVDSAAKHGLGLLFSLTGPAPDWATGKPERSDIEQTYEPSATDFRDFVTAVGTRYSGTWRDPAAEAPGPLPLPPPIGGGGGVAGPLIPRVGHWSVWNEPNHPGWLTPQWRSGSKPAAAHLYRDLVDAAWSGLSTSGHGGDVILLGETAPRGKRTRGLTDGMRPLEFIRELYCLSSRYRRYRGSRATARGCPADPAGFPGAHPGLFAAPGWAHHPYALELPPRTRDRTPGNAVLADTPRLVAALDRALAAHGRRRALPVWFTEYGYQTDPPDPTIGVSWGTQASWLNEADFLAYRQKRVASVAQFLLVDDAPLKAFSSDDPRYWGTFQSGLETQEGKRKPAFTSYQRSIYVSPRSARRGRKVRVFAQLRTAADGTALSARLQFRGLRSRRWRTLKRVKTGNPRGFLQAYTRATRSGRYRLVWAVGRGQATRAVTVRVR